MIMAKRTRKAPSRSLAPSEPTLPVLNPPPADAAYFWMAEGDPHIAHVEAGTPLAASADWYSLGASWVRIERGEPAAPVEYAPPPVPFTLDDDVPESDPPFTPGRDLFASRNLSFAWLERGASSPIALDHPEEPGAQFYRVDLAFLAWVRGMCKRAHERGAALTADQQRAVNRVWAHVCAREGVTDDDRSKLPDPDANALEEKSAMRNRV